MAKKKGKAPKKRKKSGRTKKQKGGLLGRIFGSGEEPIEADDESSAGEMTMVPNYANEVGDPELTMVPEYVDHGGPGAGGVDPYNPPAGAEMTMAPNYAGGGLGGPDPYNPPAGAEMTMAPNYAAGGAPGGGGPDPFNFDSPEPSAGEMTMQPNYAAGGGADPFNFDTPEQPPSAGEMTMQPNYAAGGPATGGPGAGAVDPYNPPAGAEMTMVPNYAGGAGGGAPGATPGLDPFNPPAGAEMTMVPNYAGGAGGAAPGLDPFNPPAGAEMTMAPNYAGGVPGAPGAPAGAPGAPAGLDPFSDPFGAGPPPQGEMTMQTEYPAGGVAPAQATGSAGLPDPFADAFNFDTPAGGGGDDSANALTIDPFGPPPGVPSASPDPFGGPPAVANPFGAPAISPGDPFNFDMPEGQTAAPGAQPIDPFGNPAAPPADPFAATIPQAAPVAELGGLELGDPFGPPLLDDPGAGVDPTGAAPAAMGMDGDFQGENTIVDLYQDDIAGLAQLEESRELDLGDLSLEPGGAVAAPAPPVAPFASMPAVPAVGAPAAPVGPTPPRPLFGSNRPDPEGTVLWDPSAAVVIDQASGIVYAPPGNWSSVPPGFATLSDGSVFGRAKVMDPRTVRIDTPAGLEEVSAQDEGVKLPPFPVGVKVDAKTGAVLVPPGLEGKLAWRPRRTWQTEKGLSFLLPAGFRVDPDGSCMIPLDAVPQALLATVVTKEGDHPAHGKVVCKLEYLGLVERCYENGWTRLDLSAEAVVEGESLLLPLSARNLPGTPPTLLRVSERDGRLAFLLPPGGRKEPDGMWFPPLVPELDSKPESLADVDSPVKDVREYLGIRDELLENGWIRLEIPADARVVDGTLFVPAQYAISADAEILGEFDPEPNGALSFALPERAEVLGSLVLIPPEGADVSAAAPAPSPWATKSAPRKAPAAKSKGKGKKGKKGKGEPEAAAETKVEDPPKEEGKKKKMSGLDRFRGGKKPQDDVMTFDGVLPSKEEEAAASDTGDVVEDEGATASDEGPTASKEGATASDEGATASEEGEVDGTASDEGSTTKKSSSKRKRKRRGKKKDGGADEG